MITLITGGQSIQRKALMSSLTAALPNYCTSQYTYFGEDLYKKIIEWCFEDNNDVYFLLDDKDKYFFNLSAHTRSDFKFIDRHFHIIETFDNLFVYEFDTLTTELTNAQTIRNAKKYVFNPNYAHVALQPYVNNKLFKSFKALCFFAYVGAIAYSIFAIIFYKDVSRIHQAIDWALVQAFISATFLLAFTTFQRVAYE